MIRFILTIIFCCLFITTQAVESEGITKKQAQAIVENFYSGIQKLPNLEDDGFYQLRDSKIYPNLIDNDAFRHPNDIYHIVSNEKGGSNWRRINSYMRDIQNWSKYHKLTIKYKICDIKDLREVVYQNKQERSELTYWQLMVDKAVTLNGKTTVINDTVDVKICNGKIAFISNRYYRSDTPVTKGIDGEAIESLHNEMVARAARFWNQGRKREAYDMYVKSVENYDAPDIDFRIGVLLLRHHKECTNLSRSKARNLAYQYFLKARKKGHQEAKRVIEWYWDGSRDHMI